MRTLMNVWPPFVGAGIRVVRIDADWKAIDVEMPLRWWNRNYVGTHYGGSLYSMTDPFYMVMLINILGHDYIVWDKSASIRFRTPGRGRMFASFRVSDVDVERIREALETEDKIDWVFTVDVRDNSGVVVAQVEKQVQVRRRAR